MTVNIRSTRENANGETFYVLKVQRAAKCWEVQRRYSEFVSLFEALSRKYPDHQLPGLPRKHMFTSKTASVVNERIYGLGKCIQHVVFVTKLCDDRLVHNFLAVEKSSDELEARLSQIEEDVRRSSRDVLNAQPADGPEGTMVSPCHGRDRSLSAAERIKQHRSGDSAALP